MSSIYRAGRPHIHRLRLLIQTGRHSFSDFGSEDLASLLTDGVVMAGEDMGEIWGAVIFRRNGPERARLCGAWLADGRSPIIDIPRLLAGATPWLRDAVPVHLVAYASRKWLGEPLRAAGFILADRLVFLALEKLQQRTLEPLPHLPHVRLRPARTDDQVALAELDAAAFAPDWRMREQELTMLLLTARVALAERGDELVGYTALTPHADRVAHLARLAVKPDARRMGLGRLLLADVLHAAQRDLIATLLLNTQSSNQAAYSLYRNAGFRPTGKVVPVFTKLLL
ncbi:MAG: GNAT family N-acetyltransferase [Caldilineaceae bacterium]|nr:GNAT family N-acetyltransferase [Caldilineaceae bacterium]